MSSTWVTACEVRVESSSSRSFAWSVCEGLNGIGETINEVFRSDFVFLNETWVLSREGVEVVDILVYFLAGVDVELFNCVG